MHSLQFIAIEYTPSSDLENANQEVSQEMSRILEADYPKWTDWYSIDDSRWKSQYGIINAKRDPDQWKEAIKQAKTWRAEHIESMLKDAKVDKFAQTAELYRKKLLGIGYQPWNALDGMTMNMDIYYVNRLASIMNGDWSADSVFYDMADWSPWFDKVEERIKSNPEIQWLVPVDFHH